MYGHLNFVLVIGPARCYRQIKGKQYPKSHATSAWLRFRIKLSKIDRFVVTEQSIIVKQYNFLCFASKVSFHIYVLTWSFNVCFFSRMWENSPSLIILAALFICIAFLNMKLSRTIKFYERSFHQLLNASTNNGWNNHYLFGCKMWMKVDGRENKYHRTFILSIFQ